MNPEDNPADERYEIDLCNEEIRVLQSQLAAVTAKRDEAVALLREIHAADTVARREVERLGMEAPKLFYEDRLAAIINKETP